jgi:hypothetical protein
VLALFGMVVSEGRKLRRAWGLGDYDARVTCLPVIALPGTQLLDGAPIP